MRNLVICCDGTANEFATERTNVSKLVFCVDQNEDRQLVYYHPGLGTMAPPGALTRTAQEVTRALGLMVGYGLPSDVAAIYTFLINTYRDGDRLFLFGFSRGAYVVRAVASLIYAYGLIPRGSDPLVRYAVRYMTTATARSKSEAEVLAALATAAAFKDTFSRTRPCPIHFVGIFDTVGSIGWFWRPVALPFTADNAGIVHGRHAIALDERRAFFRPNLWRRNERLAEHGPRDVKQVWFAGVHADVGGGYPEAESGLSKIALAWMIREAATCGLLLDDDRTRDMLGEVAGSLYTPPRPGADPHESLCGWWQVLEFVPKPNQFTGRWRANRGRRRSLPKDAVIHVSALKQPCGYLAERGLPGRYTIEE
jgi:uncharacterized protein (DUF2235 family)